MKGRINIRIASVLFGICFLSSSVFAQEKTIDRVVAVVGKNIILQSEIEAQYQQFISQGNTSDPGIRCGLLDQLLLNKLMVNQAELDSVQVSDAQVDGELDRRIRYFISQIGSEKKLEEYYKKSIVEIKSEFRDVIKQQLLAQTIQSKLTKDVNASPSDVRAYFERIPHDSLPFISTEMEVAQIVKYPAVSEDSKKAVKDQLEDIRNKILNGTDFAVLAGLYSQDPGSAKKGGELGFTNRGDLVPEFEAIAFSLKGKEISKVFETKYGYHIVQLIERRGAQINVRHILLKPKVSTENLVAAGAGLDSLARLIRGGEITFADAAQKYSDDGDTKNNGGLMVNAAAGNTRFEPEQMDPQIFFLVDKLKAGEVSDPKIFTAADGRQGYRMLKLLARTEPHRANLKDDYQKIQNAALNEKQNKAITDWVAKKKATTFIRIDKDFKDCPELKNWFE